jgi:hypothetical protein
VVRGSDGGEVVFGDDCVECWFQRQMFQAASGNVRTAPNTTTRPLGRSPLPPPQLQENGPKNQNPMHERAEVAVTMSSS